MNLTESIKHLMSEGKLEWTTTDEVTGAEEATLPDGSKFAIHNITGTLSLMYVGKDGKGNVIYRTPAGVPMAFKKAKQEAEKFLGIKKDKDSKKEDDKKADKKEGEVEEELGSENEWGTDELTDKEKAVTPGQTPKKEGLEDACWSGYKAIGTKEKDGKTVPNCVPESTDEDLKSLQDLLNNPDEEFAVKNYGSVERYKKMIQSKIDKLQKNEDFSGASFSGAGQTTLKPTDKISVRYGSLYVNDRPFEAKDPDEALDWPNSTDSNGNLVTWFKGDSNQKSTWKPEQITGRYTDKEDVGIEEKVEVSERYVKTMQLITKETDRSIIEAFLTEHTIAGRESNLLAINTEFKRFKKLHEAENFLSNDTMKDLVDKIRLKISKVIDDEWHNTAIIHDWIKENPEKVSHYMSRKNWDSLASIAADEISTKWEEDPKGHYGKYLDHRQYLHPSGQTRRSSLYKSLPI